MLDLKMILDKYPRSAGTRTQLASLLHDLYPSEKRAVNVALAVYDSGITSRLAGLKSIDSVLLHSFIKQLVDEFGLQEQFATEGIEVWAKAYGISVSNAKVVQQPAEQHEPITHNSDAYAKPGMANGLASDYELEQRSQGVVITKFRGFDKANVIIPNTIDGKKIVGIGEGAYFNCKAIETLLISDGIEFIENGAFANCESLRKVTFPTSLLYIGSSKQTNRYPVRRFGSNKIPKGAFANNCGLIKVSLPEGLKKLGEETFMGCRNLISVDMPNGLTEVDGHAFSSCISLSQIVLPEMLSKIGDAVFWGCEKINDISFPLSLREIGKYAFYNCSALTVVVLNEGLNKIGENAFNYCSKLSKVLIPSTVSEIEEPLGFDDIFGLGLSKNKNLTVYCYSGSYGLEYARKKGYPIQNAANFHN